MAASPHIPPIGKEVAKLSRARRAGAKGRDVGRWVALFFVVLLALVLTSPFMLERPSVPRAGSRITEPVVAWTAFQFLEKVNETKGNAKWDASKSLLTVTLPIIHDLDSKMTTTSQSNEID